MNVRPFASCFRRLDTAGIEEAVLINTSGGIAGGDRLDTAVTALADAHITLTSQAAERIYRALDEPSRISTTLVVANSAKLSWCPQETIVFDRALMKRQTHISVSSGAELLALESIVLGRAAHGETVASGEVVDSWRVEKDGRLVWADSLRITDDVFPHLRRNALLADCTAVATLVYFGPDLEKRLECLRDWAASLGVPRGGDDGRRADRRPFRSNGGFHTAGGIVQRAPGVRSRVRARPVPCAEDVVVLKAAARGRRR